MAEKYQALYRKWRPLVFEDVVGQDHVSETLRNSIVSGRIGHAYLFCGTRGTGKTSSAKIFSRAVNCTDSQNGNPCNKCDSCRGILDGSILDVYEMDAASNSGIDNIREIRDEVIYSPTGCKYKVYIIDEAHMLTTEAFNALLKTLEEPPAHVIFILATTEPHKIPATIHSRCQRFDFRRIGLLDIEKRLKKIVQEENIEITPDALELVSELADGSMRDGLSILDQCIAFARGELRYDDVVDIVGVADRRVLFSVVDAIADFDTKTALDEADSFLKKGKEASDFIEELIAHFRGLMICKSTSQPNDILEKTEEVIEKFKAQAEKFSLDRIISGISVLGDFLLQSKKLSTPMVAVEMAIVKLCSAQNSDGDSAELILRLEKLEKELQTLKTSGVAVRKSSPKQSPSTEAVEAAPMDAAPHVAEAESWSKWREALVAIKQESKMLYTFLFNATALYFGDEIELVISGDLAYNKINTTEGKEYLSTLFSKIQGTALRVVVSRQGSLKKRDGKAATVMDIAEKKDILGDKMTVVEE